MNIFKSKQAHIVGRRSKPVRQLAGPICKLCSDASGKTKHVSSEELVDCLPGDGKPYARVLVKCHGQEELMEFDMGTEGWDFEKLAKKMGRHVWFDMAKIAEMGR